MAFQAEVSGLHTKVCQIRNKVPSKALGFELIDGMAINQTLNANIRCTMEDQLALNWTEIYRLGSNDLAKDCAR